MNVIIIHIFPTEINEYQRVISRIHDNIINMEKTLLDKLELKTCLNLNTEIVGEEYKNQFKLIIESFKKINSSLKIKTTETITTSFRGVNDHRRNSIRLSQETDSLIFLDSDLHFRNDILVTMLEYITQIRKNERFYIITPQVVRLWDSSWDILVNNKYKNKKLGYCDVVNIEDIIKTEHGKQSLSKINKFKWAGGWFTCISAKLAKYIGIPKTFDGYGPDDTHMMHCCEYLKINKIDVNQYIMKNNIVCEDRSLVAHKTNLAPNLFRKNANRYMVTEYNNFKKRVKVDIYKNNET